MIATAAPSDVIIDCQVEGLGLAPCNTRKQTAGDVGNWYRLSRHLNWQVEISGPPPIYSLPRVWRAGFRSPWGSLPWAAYGMNRFHLKNPRKHFWDPSRTEMRPLHPMGLLELYLPGKLGARMTRYTQQGLQLCPRYIRELGRAMALLLLRKGRGTSLRRSVKL